MSSYKLKLAIIFDQDFLSGGGFQQAINASLVASKINENISEVKFYSTKKNGARRLINYGIKAKFIKINLIKRILLYFKTSFRYRIIYKFISLFYQYNFFESFLLKDDINIVYFISPSRFALDLDSLNYIFTVWDTCHRDHVEFPEVRINSEFEEREFRLNNALKKATAIIAESEYGKNNLLKRYNLERERIKIIPLEPGTKIKSQIDNQINCLDNLKKFNINDRFIFYPAQFWPHKNHIYIIDGIKILIEKYDINISAVFSGSDKGNKKFIKKYVALNNLEKNIIFTNFISDEEITYLYLNCIALVMPTYFGPTNIPPYEAFRLGTPVLYPEELGIQDNIEDAILSIKYEDPDTMASQINKLLNDEQLRQNYIKKGYEKTKFLEKIDRTEILNNILIDFRRKFLCSKEF